MRARFIIEFVLCGALAVATGGAIRDVGPPNSEKSAPVSSADQAFMSRLANDNAAQIKLGRYALKKTSNHEVRGVAEMIIRGRMDVNERLAAVAHRKHVRLSETITDEETSLKARLGGLFGSAFDDAYLRAMIQVYESTVAIVRRESDASDADIRELAERTLPILENHLDDLRLAAAKGPLASTSGISSE